MRRLCIRGRKSGRPSREIRSIWPIRAWYSLKALTTTVLGRRMPKLGAEDGAANNVGGHLGHLAKHVDFVVREGLR